MNEAIGIRLEDDFLKKIETLSKEEVLDRSSTIRKLLYLGYNDFVKKKAAEDYVKGKKTLSKAAETAEITIWEMEQFLIEKGYKSNYSLDDLKEELELIK